MNEKEIAKDIKYRMRFRFWVAALGCFAVITVLSLLLWGLYKYYPRQKQSAAELEAAELIERIDSLSIGGNSRNELEKLEASYGKLSGKLRQKVTQERYDRLLEAMELEKFLEEEDAPLLVADKSRNKYDMEFGKDAGMRLVRRNGKIAFEGQTEIEGDTFHELFCGNHSFTIEAEINPNGWGYKDGEMNMIASKGDNCAALRISSQSVYFFIRNTDEEWKGVKMALTEEQMNSWIHVAAIYNGSDISVYLEGKELETLKEAGTVVASEYPLGIGYCPEMNRTSRNSIKSFRVYSRALTKEELDQGTCTPEDAAVWYDFSDYICKGLDTEIKGMRSSTRLVKVPVGGEAQVQAEPVPYYAKEDILYSVDNEEAAAVSGSGILYGNMAETVSVTAKAEGTKYSVEIPVDISNPALNFYDVLEWMVQRILYIDAAVFALCLFCIMAVQRRKAISYVTKISEALYFIGKDAGKTELPPVLGNTQNLIREVEDSLRQKEHAADEAEKRKNDMVVYLAHDLKTPIASIIGYLTLLRDEKQISPEMHQRYLEIALGNSERLDDLVSEFFEITRFNLSYLTLVYQEIYITWMLEQLIAEFEPMLAEKGLTCRLEAAEDICLRCDAEKIERVFSNLLRNAINYSFPNTEICLTVTAAEQVEITCTNYGETIPQEKLNRIFEQFYRLDSARSSRTGGSGLGLAIAKQLVELHHGEIKAKSKKGQICFTVTLPFQEEPEST